MEKKETGRVIQFRAWDGKSTMYYADREPFYFSFIKGSWGFWRQDTEELVLGSTTNPEAVLMQFTGLLDRNGKEIYEGDIVRLKNWRPEVYQVMFSRGGFCFVGSGEAQDYAHDAKFLEGSEVIGNIYEHPELLN